VAGYEFPAEVMTLVMNPKTYTTLTLYYMTVLRTGAGWRFIEVARSNMWKQNGLTDRRPWEFGAIISKACPAKIWRTGKTV